MCTTKANKKCTTVEPLYNEVLGTMKITLLYQVSHIRVKKQRNIKSWDQQNYLVIRGFCFIRPRYNEVPLYKHPAFKQDTNFLKMQSKLFKLAATSWNLEIRLHVYRSWHEHMIWYQSNLYHHLIGSCIWN